MEPEEKENTPDTSNKESQQSAADRIETPFPAQEIFPLDQSKNDGKHKENHNELKEESNNDI